MHYLDSSALVKLVAKEPESAALFEFLKESPELISSALARVEVLRAVARADGPEALALRADEVLASVALVRIDDEILSQASRILPSDLRTLDAIHLATGLALRNDLVAFVAYDKRLAAAAQELGLEGQAPGA